MENTIKALDELREFFEDKVDEMDDKTFHADNGERDKKSAFRETITEEVDQAIQELTDLKNRLLNQKK